MQYSMIFTSALAAITTVHAAPIEQRTPQGVLGGLLGDGGSGGSRSGNGSNSHPGGVGSLLGGLTGRDVEVEKRTPRAFSEVSSAMAVPVLTTEENRAVTLVALAAFWAA
ncbi:hypothetical protein PG984_014250 [Apiospora sp. TS-2023a]